MSLSLILLVLYCFYVSADIITRELKDKNTCNTICKDSSFLLPTIKDAEDTCERGCRFFDIIYLTNEHDINGTKQQCYSSCKEAYSIFDNGMACMTGCSATAKAKEIELTNILAFIKQVGAQHVFLETEIELLESDILSDPIIKEPRDYEYTLEYKIPETKIRTMPIMEIIERNIIESKARASKDWLDCAAENSGVPKSILLTAMLVATVVMLLLLILNAKHTSVETMEDIHDPETKNQKIEVNYNYSEEKICLSGE